MAKKIMLSNPTRQKNGPNELFEYYIKLLNV